MSELRSAPAVSVIMPVHDPRDDWFEAAVKSVLDEPPGLVELIIVDDGSTEPVRSPVDDDRIVVIHSDHRGSYGARDVGVEHARATYIRFFDADDLSISGSTSRLLEAMTGRDDIITYGSTVMVDEHLGGARRISEIIDGDAVPSCLLGGFDAYHVSMLFPAWCVRAAGGFTSDLPISGDWDFVLRACEHAHVRRVDADVTVYRRSSTSMTGRSVKARGVEARRAIIDRYASRHPDAPKGLLRAAHAETDLDLARWYSAEGHRLRCWLWRARAMARNPHHVAIGRRSRGRDRRARR